METIGASLFFPIVSRSIIKLFITSPPAFLLLCKIRQLPTPSIQTGGYFNSIRPAPCQKQIPDTSILKFDNCSYSWFASRSLWCANKHRSRSWPLQKAQINQTQMQRATNNMSAMFQLNARPVSDNCSLVASFTDLKGCDKKKTRVWLLKLARTLFKNGSITAVIDIERSIFFSKTRFAII